MPIVHCSGHDFRETTWGQDRCDKKHWVCKICAFKVKTKAAVLYFTGKIA